MLFTGDFMGGVNSRNGDGVFATEDSWEGIKLFHQLYMPSTKAVRKTVERISMLNPFPEVIAPQHGDVIRGPLVTEFLSRMSQLEVGIDLVEENNPEVDLTLLGINTFLELLGVNFPEVRNDFLERFQKGNDFTSPFLFEKGVVTSIKVSPDNALLQVYSVISELGDRETRQHLRAMFLDSLDQLDIHFQVQEDNTGGAGLARNEDSLNLDDMIE